MDISELVRGLKMDDEDSVKSLKRMGKDAITPLKNLFLTAEPEVALSIMEALVMVADETCSDFFLKTLESPVQEIRSMAAQGLLRINHPSAVQALIKTIVDYPDEGHAQFSHSSYALIGLGSKVLPDVVPLLDDENLFVREYAWTVVSNIVTRGPEFEDSWMELWEELGRYDPHQLPLARRESVGRWRRWVNNNM